MTGQRKPTIISDRILSDREEEMLEEDEEFVKDLDQESKESKGKKYPKWLKMSQMSWNLDQTCISMGFIKF